MPGVTLDTIELPDPASIDAFAERFLDENDTLHILVNNAGVLAPPWRAMGTVTNRISPPTMSAISNLRAVFGPRSFAPDVRASWLSSPLGIGGPELTFTSPNFLRRPYEPRIAYGQSKTANSLFAVALDLKMARGAS